jgi:gamma-glutamyltranspeptidase/glutathione hydrolase
LETFPLKSLGYHSAESLHVMIEALKLARLDRQRFGGDPDFLSIPIQSLLDKNYALKNARLIQSGVARCVKPGGESTEDSTTHFVVRDKEGNIVSGTQTIGSVFGCGEVIEKTGILINDRSWWMALHDGPNRVVPGHKANIGHSPAILLSRGRPFMALGSPGGDGIIQYVVQIIVNTVDYGFNIQEAIEAPRFRSIDLCAQVNMENRIDETIRSRLKTWGHKITDYPEWTPSVGAVEGFMVNLETGNIIGGYDPRRNSMAMGF